MPAPRLGQIKVLIPVLTSALLLGLLVLSQWQAGQRDTQRLQDQRARVIERSLANLSSILSGFNPEVAATRLNQLLANLPALSSVRVTDANGEIIYSNDTDLMGTKLADSAPSLSLLNVLQAESSAVVSLDDGTRLLGAGQYCGIRGDCGLIYLESDLNAELTAAKLLRVREMLGQAVLVMLATLIVAVAMHRRVSNISQETVSALQEFRKGNRSIRIESSGAEELELIKDETNLLFADLETEKIRSEEKRARYETLLEAMPGSLISIQHDGKIESVNRAAERLLGYPAKEIVGSNISLFINDESVHDAEDWLQERDGTQQEVEARNKQGRDFTARFSLKSLKLDSQQLYIGVMIDVSPLKRLELELLNLNSKLRQSNQKLEQTSITDALTGLANRRHFDASLNKELQRTTRQSSPLSLLVVDIDFFKQFNDHYGHSAGDECLAKVGECLRSVFKRSGDLPARYGGEEFAVILPACDGLELQERAETLRLAVHDMHIPHAYSDVCEYITVSIGAVTYKPESAAVVAPKPKDLFSEADKALYRAKNSGRDQVVFAGQFLPATVGQISPATLAGSLLVP